MRKKLCFFQMKFVLVLVLFSCFLSVSKPADAGIFDDIIEDIVDAVKKMFSSAKNLTEAVVDKVDNTAIPNIAARCALVEADNRSGDVEVESLESNCGHSVNRLKDVFISLGGSVAQQAVAVENSLEETSKEVWRDNIEPFADSVREVVLFYGEATLGVMKDLSDELFRQSRDLKTTLSNFSFPSGDLSNGTNIDLIYNLDLGDKMGLEFFVRGMVAATAEQSGTKYIALTGSVVVRVKSSAGLGYTPMVFAQLDYTNPIVKLEGGRITGLMVKQPDGSISFSGVALPLQFSARLDQLKSVPGLKNLPIPDAVGKAMSFDVDIGTVAITLPLTNQEDSKFNFYLSVSGGVDAIAEIVGNWRVRLAERVSWGRSIGLDIPPIKLPLNSVPPGLLGELDSTSEPSQSQLLLSYNFNDSNHSAIIEDTSGNGNFGTKYGGLDIRDGAAYFNGTDAHILLPDNLMQDITDITIYSEVQINQNQRVPYFIYGMGNIKGDWGDGYLFSTGDLYRTALSSCEWVCEQNVGSYAMSLPRNSWQKMAYTLKGSVATLYLNGDIVAKNENVTLKPKDIGAGITRANFIGRSLYSADYYFHGAMKNFQVWDGALSHAEIVEKFASGDE